MLESDGRPLELYLSRKKIPEKKALAGKRTAENQLTQSTHGGQPVRRRREKSGKKELGPNTKKVENRSEDLRETTLVKF